MWQTTEAVRVTPADFLWKRVTRVMPLYWLATLAMFSMMFVSNTMVNGREHSIPDLMASLFCIPLDGPNLFFPVYFPGWTINFEMLFYVIFGLCLFVSGRLQRGACLLLVLVALVGIGAAFDGSPTLQWYTAPMLLEFGAGVVIAMYFSKGTVIRREIALGAMALGIAIIVCCAPRPEDDLLGSRLTTFGAAASLIVFGAVFLERSGAVARVGALRFWGDASYSMYLTHMFAINAVAMFWMRAGLWTSTYSLVHYVVVAFLASLAIAACSYWFFEMPLLRFSREMRFRSFAGNRAPRTGTRSASWQTNISR